MVEIKKQTDLIALLFLLLLMLFSMLVFAQDNPLKKGVATDNNCTNFEHYSTQQVTAESGVNITLFLRSEERV